MRITFVTSGLDFDGDTLKTRALGGSETALLCMARELGDRGHTVKVFCNCSRPGRYGNVDYYHRAHFPSQAAVIASDVLIASRWVQFLSVPSIAGLRVLWLHDMPSAEKKDLMPLLWQTDLLLGLSDYHIEQYANAFPELAPHFWKTSNGVDLDVIDANIRPKVPGKLIYTSRPERGLEYLLRQVLPRIVEKRPDVRLHYCHYPLDHNMETPEYVRDCVENCERLTEKYAQNVVAMGSLTKPALYQQISSAQLFLYPTSFPEISCLGLMEAQSCGTPVVTTDAFALSETGGPGVVKIPGTPADQEYADAFANAALELLDNPEKYQEKVAQCRPYVLEKGYTWKQVAESWERKFEETLRARLATNYTRIAKELIRTNDPMTAKLTATARQDLEVCELAEEKITECAAREYEPGDVVDRYAKATPRFQKLLMLLDNHKANIETFCDFACDDVSFGIAVKAKMPHVEVTLVPLNEDVGDRLAIYAEKAGLQVNIVDAQGLKGPFDVLHLEEGLDIATNPQATLESLTKYLKDGGVFTFSTRYGDDCHTIQETPKRLWNFDCADLEDIFKPTNNGYVLAFHDSRARQVDEQIHGYWLGVAQKSTKYGKLNLQDKLRRTRPYQSVAATIIAKDAEEWLPVCLKSIKPYVDKIALVDTGSGDNTIEVAKQYGAQVVEITFDNFAQSKNAAIEQAPEADWILSIDTDERLVGGDMLRKYLHTRIFNGFVIKQNHLQLDVKEVTFDQPMRVWRNKPEYRFTGYIHEHVEDTSQQPYDGEVGPALVLPEVDIAHYGYTNERQRRYKCSRRNLELLIRDYEENMPKGRMLTWVLVMRDYLNMVKWSLEKNGPVQYGSFEHDLLNAAITTYHHKFADQQSKYWGLAKDIYRDSLMMLAACGLPYGKMDRPPFEVAFAMGGAIGGLNQEKQIKPDRLWFLCGEEFSQFVTEKTADFVDKLGVGGPPALKLAMLEDVLLPLPDAKKLLSKGLHAI